MDYDPTEPDPDQAQIAAWRAAELMAELKPFLSDDFALACDRAIESLEYEASKEENTL